MRLAWTQHAGEGQENQGGHVGPVPAERRRHQGAQHRHGGGAPPPPGHACATSHAAPMCLRSDLSTPTTALMVSV
eukprot:7329119-Pyramimonas_sp.AAC.1